MHTCKWSLRLAADSKMANVTTVAWYIDSSPSSLLARVNTTSVGNSSPSSFVRRLTLCLLTYVGEDFSDLKAAARCNSSPLPRSKRERMAIRLFQNTYFTILQWSPYSLHSIFLQMCCHNNEFFATLLRPAVSSVVRFIIFPRVLSLRLWCWPQSHSYNNFNECFQH
jgi:hypothetical protein